MHLRSGAGETSTTGNGEPSSAAIRAEGRNFGLEAVDLGDHRFEPRRRVERARHLDCGGKRRAIVAAARIEMADEMSGADGAQPLGLPQRSRRVVGIETQTQRRRRSERVAERDADRRLPMSARGRRACDLQRNRLFERHVLRQRVRPGQSERAHIGLVGGVGPVALILHLEGVALHPAFDARAGRELVLDGAQVHHRLDRVDQFGK